MSKRPGDPGYAPGWCIHYRPSSGTVTTCEAGVPFDRFAKTPFQARPCFLLPSGESKPDAVAYEHLRRPTAEEIAAHQTWAQGRQQMLFTAIAAIDGWRTKHTGTAHAETIDCPVCNTGQLRLAISGRRGHGHGRCSTPGCVSWME